VKKSSSISLLTVTAIVVANMIGAGIFTSLGFQLVSTVNTWSILILWSLGALMALCGALSYAELGTYWMRSGGEYNFLSKAYHPLLGYLSGWASLTIGFAAPVALSGMALGEYVAPYLNVSKMGLAIGVVISVSFFHSMSLKRSSLLQDTTTILKVALILVFIAFGLYYKPEASAFLFNDSWKSEILLPGFAVSFVYVSYSYLGWNAAAYITDEIKDARKNLPKALLIGTFIVSVLYILLTLVFLKHNPLSELQGQLEVGQITAVSLFGSKGGEWVSFGIALLLISSISAMIWSGPRVTQVMAEDHSLWQWFSNKKNDIPVRTIWLQTAITLFLLITGSFEQVMIYSSFVLQLFAALAVAGVFVVRKQKKKHTGFKSPLFPVPQLLFLIFSVWVLVYLLIAQPLESGLGLLNLVIGAGVYSFDRWVGRKKTEG